METLEIEELRPAAILHEALNESLGHRDPCRGHRDVKKTFLSVNLANSGFCFPVVIGVYRRSSAVPSSSRSLRLCGGSSHPCLQVRVCRFAIHEFFKLLRKYASLASLASRNSKKARNDGLFSSDASPVLASPLRHACVTPREMRSSGFRVSVLLGDLESWLVRFSGFPPALE
jgi:hypothetical protein